MQQGNTRYLINISRKVLVLYLERQNIKHVVNSVVLCNREDGRLKYYDLDLYDVVLCYVIHLHKDQIRGSKNTWHSQALTLTSQ